MSSRTPSQRARRGFLVSMLIGISGIAAAAEVNTSFSVTATVNAVARLDVTSQPAQLTISHSDVRRGYIDVPQPTNLIVRSNSTNGFALDVRTNAPIASSITVRGLDGNRLLGADGGTLEQHWAAAEVMSVSLNFRLVLEPGVLPGTYAWPLQLAVRALETG